MRKTIRFHGLLLNETLRRAGYEVIATEDGPRALQELDKEDPPRLALLDWIMPGLDGFLERVQAGYRSGSGMGADDYLTKSFDAEELKARLPAGQRILDLEDCLVAARESSCASRPLTISLLHFGIVA